MKKVIVVALIAGAFLENASGAVRTAEASPLRIKVEQLAAGIVSAVRDKAERVKDGADRLRTDAVAAASAVKSKAEQFKTEAATAVKSRLNAIETRLTPYEGLQEEDIIGELARTSERFYSFRRKDAESEEFADKLLKTRGAYLSRVMNDETGHKYEALKKALSRCGEVARYRGIAYCRERLRPQFIDGFNSLCEAEDDCRKAALESLKAYQNIRNQNARSESEKIYPLGYAALGFALYKCQSKPKKLDIAQARSGFIWGRDARVALHPETTWFD